MLTRCGGLWDGLVDARAKAAADGDVAGGVVGLPALVPQLLLSPPLCSPIREPYLQRKRLVILFLQAFFLFFVQVLKCSTLVVQRQNKLFQ